MPPSLTSDGLAAGAAWAAGDAAGYKLDSPAELGPALTEALAADRPAVIDVPLTLDVPWR